MPFTAKEKEELKQKLVSCLIKEKEIVKIVVFGSFVDSDAPNDMDIAVFQDSDEDYLPLAMKYRKRIHEVSDIIPIDIIPLKSQVKTDPFLSEIANGEILYER